MPRKPDIERQRAMDEARARREEKQRVLDVAVKRYFAEGMSTGEIAEALRCDRETVRKSVLRQGLREKQAVPCQPKGGG